MKKKLLKKYLKCFVFIVTCYVCTNGFILTDTSILKRALFDTTDIVTTYNNVMYSLVVFRTSKERMKNFFGILEVNDNVCECSTHTIMGRN